MSSTPLRRHAPRKPAGSTPMRVEYRDQKKVPVCKRCPECKEVFNKMMLPGQALRVKLCGKTKCKLSDQRKRSLANNARLKRAAEHKPG